MNEARVAAAIDDTPSAALGPAWELLDVLPSSAALPTMTSTTVEMVAAASRPRQVRGGWWRGWLAPVAIVATSFLAGVVAGRTTVTDPDQAMFEHLPVIDHYDVLREAGSVEFLTAVARRNYPPPPRRPAFARPGERGGEGPPPAHESLDAAVAAFAKASFGADAAAARDHRAEFDDQPADERRRLVDAATGFQRLSATQRRDLVRLARTLGGKDGVGPDRDELLEAARLWHQWLSTRDPAERKGVIDLGTDERLEWLDRYAQQRPMPGRGGAFRDGGGFRGSGPPGGPFPEGPPREGPPFNGRPPHDPRRGPPPPPPGESPGPPR